MYAPTHRSHSVAPKLQPGPLPLLPPTRPHFERSLLPDNERQLAEMGAVLDARRILLQLSFNLPGGGYLFRLEIVVAPVDMYLWSDLVACGVLYCRGPAAELVPRSARRWTSEEALAIVFTSTIKQWMDEILIEGLSMMRTSIPTVRLD